MAWRRQSPDSKVHEAHMGPTWGRQDPGVPHVGPMKIVIWVYLPQFYLTHWASSTGEFGT